MCNIISVEWLLMDTLVALKCIDLFGFVLLSTLCISLQHYNRSSEKKRQKSTCMQNKYCILHEQLLQLSKCCNIKKCILRSEPVRFHFLLLLDNNMLHHWGNQHLAPVVLQLQVNLITLFMIWTLFFVMVAEESLETHSTHTEHIVPAQLCCSLCGLPARSSPSLMGWMLLEVKLGSRYVTKTQMFLTRGLMFYSLHALWGHSIAGH